jgi:hypothetical protein
MPARANPNAHPGWIRFSVIVLFAVGIFRIIAAIARFLDSTKINDFSGVFENHAWGWGIFDLAIGVLALLAAFSLVAGGRYGRLFAYAWAVLAMINAFMIIEFVPTYAVTTIALAALVLYAMLVTGPQADSR